VGRQDIGRRQQLSHGHVELLRARCRAANITRMFVVYRIPLNKFWVLTTCCHPIRRRTHTRALFHDTTFHINNNIMTSGTRYCLRNTHAPPTEVGLLLFLLLSSSLPTIEQTVLIIILINLLASFYYYRYYYFLRTSMCRIRSFSLVNRQLIYRYSNWQRICLLRILLRLYYIMSLRLWIAYKRKMAYRFLKRMVVL